MNAGTANCRILPSTDPLGAEAAPGNVEESPLILAVAAETVPSFVAAKTVVGTGLADSDLLVGEVAGRAALVAQSSVSDKSEEVVLQAASANGS